MRPGAIGGANPNVLRPTPKLSVATSAAVIVSPAITARRPSRSGRVSSAERGSAKSKWEGSAPDMPERCRLAQICSSPCNRVHHRTVGIYMQTQTAPATPVSPTAPAVAGTPAAPAAPVPGTITIVGRDGVVKTIVLPSNTSPFIERAAEQAAQSAADRAGRGPRGDQFGQGMAAGVSLSLVVFAVVAFYRRYKRRGMPSTSAQTSSESPARLERMERGIEAIAIEVERISEGQRFVTNLLAEQRQPTAIGAERK